MDANREDWTQRVGPSGLLRAWLPLVTAIIAVVACVEGTEFGTAVGSSTQGADVAPQAPLTTPTDSIATIDGLPLELHFIGGGGGNPGPECYDKSPNPIPGLPALRGGGQFRDEGALCLFGFSPDEEVELEVFGPDGAHEYSALFQVGSQGETDILPVFQLDSDSGEPSRVGVADVLDDGTLVIQVAMWWPATIQGGEWYASASSSSYHAEGPFWIERRNSPRLTVLLNGPMSYFGSAGIPNCREYSVGSRFKVAGTSFNMRAFDFGQPVGLYIQRDADTVALIDHWVVEYKQNYEFTIDISSGSSFLTGVYYVVAPLRTGVDRLSLFGDDIGPWDCFRIR